MSAGWQLLAVFGYAGLVLAVIGFGASCTPAKTPCSRQVLAELGAECVARIKLTCEPGDTECPAYVDCTKRIEAWRTCTHTVVK